MILKECNGKMPKIHPTARIADTAVLIGDVTVEANANIWYGAVLRADNMPIVIGENSNIQDNVICHGDVGSPVLVGKNCTVGHTAILHSCVIEDNCLIGMSSVLLNDSHIGTGSLIGACALVKNGMQVPPRSAVIGMPGKITRQTSDEDMVWFADDIRQYLELAEAQLPMAGEQK